MRGAPVTAAQTSLPVPGGRREGDTDAGQGSGRGHRGTSEWPSAGLEPGTVREPSRPLLAAVPALWGKVTAGTPRAGPAPGFPRCSWLLSLGDGRWRDRVEQEEPGLPVMRGQPPGGPRCSS